MIVTWPTPDTLSICRLTRLSAISGHLADGTAGAERDQHDWCGLRVDLGHDRGVDALAGSRSTMPTLSRTSWAATSPGLSSLKVTQPEKALDRGRAQLVDAIDGVDGAFRSCP